MAKRILEPVLLAAALVALVGGCGDDNPSTPEPGPGVVILDMTHVVGGQAGLVDVPLEFDQLEYTNAFGNEFSVATLQYYISNIELQGPDGDYALDVPAHYVDARDEATHEITIDGISARHYDNLVFTFGLDAETNHTGALPATFENVNMQWPESWGGGYHYMKLEGKCLDPQGVEFGFPTHLGRFTDPDGVEHHHFFEVVLPIHQQITDGTTRTIEVIHDISQWYTNPNDIDLNTHFGGIMNNTAKQNLMEQNGASVFRIGDIVGGDSGGHDGG